MAHWRPGELDYRQRPHWPCEPEHNVRGHHCDVDAGVYVGVDGAHVVVAAVAVAWQPLAVAINWINVGNF